MNSTKVTFTVTDISKKNTTIDLDITVDENIATFDVDLNKSATGLVKFYVVCKETGENATIYMDVKDGHVEAVTGSMDPGNYTVVATYMGDSAFNTNIITKDFEVFDIVKISTKLTSSDVTMDYDGGKSLVATLKDENGKGIAGAKVTIKVGDFSRTLTTDSNGQVSLSLNGIVPDVYNVTIAFDGDDVYDKSNTTVKVTINKLKAKIYLRNALYFTLETKLVRVTLWDANNKPLAGKVVHITLNEYGLTYSGVTDENGDAYIRVGVGFGVHSATVSFEDEIYDLCNRTGNVRVIKETPSIMVRGNNTQFKVKDTKTVHVYLWDRNSKPLPAGSKVAIKVNGQTYVGYTDYGGIAHINININKAGIYNAELMYAGNSAYNAVTRKIKISVR